MRILGAPGAPLGGAGLHALVGRPSTSPFALAADGAIVALAALYAWSAYRTRLAGSDDQVCAVQPWAAASFAGGLLALYVALGSGLVAYERTDPTVLVVQHLLLMMVAPPLLVLGRPLALAGRVRRDPGGRAHFRVPARTSAATMALVSWPLYYGLMGVFFLTPLVSASARHSVAYHAIEAAFVAVGLLFWWGLVGVGAQARSSYALRLGGVIVGMPIETAIGLALAFWPHPLVASTTLASTHAAGLVLWIGSMLTGGVALGMLVAQWCIADAREGAEVDAVLDAAAASITPARASRPAGP